LAEGAADDEACKAAAAAAVTGTPLVVSSAGPRPALRERLERGGVRLVVESAAALAARADTLAGKRLRLLGTSEPEVLHAAADHGVDVLDEPVASHGRLELVRWLREQSVTTSLHRYGNVVYGRRATRPPEAVWGAPGGPGDLER
jgi:RHH-type proline utilization regulon transcriptional repressor/proline dehydrogenase/delta 1-pyrroline-5-carboxylate dehydrogenase